MTELRLWRQFVVLAEELHFGRAAARLHMTQPPLTQAIQGLERQLGVLLFMRTRRSVALTPAGLALLPEVRRLLAEAGLGARGTAVGGDFRRDPLPRGADLATLVRVLHDHNDDAVLDILSNLRRSLAPGATLLIAEPMSDTASAAPVADAYFGFYLLAMGQGRPRTPAEIAALALRAGFEAPRQLATRQPLLVRIVAATVPSEV